MNEIVGALTSAFKLMDDRAAKQADRRGQHREVLSGRIDAETLAAVPCTAPKYAALEAKLEAAGEYAIVTAEQGQIDEWDPPSKEDEPSGTARRRRSEFRNQAAFGFRVKKFVYTPGGQHSSLLVLWKLPEGELDEAKEATILLNLRDLLPEHHTRAMRQEFAEKFRALSGDFSPAMLRQIYRDLTADGSAPHDSAEREIDERVAEFAASNGDLDLFHDLRALNGNSGHKVKNACPTTAAALAALINSLSCNRNTSMTSFGRRRRRSLRRSVVRPATGGALASTQLSLFQ